jgi:hypothetical protein
MITILFSMTVKLERQSEFEIVAKDMTTSTRTQDQGCRDVLRHRSDSLDCRRGGDRADALARRPACRLGRHSARREVL